MKYLVILLFLPLFCTAQSTYIFDARFINYQTDSTNLYEIKIPNFKKTYNDFDYEIVEAEYYYFDTIGNNVIIEYDSIYSYAAYHFETNFFLSNKKTLIYYYTLIRVIDGDTFWAYVHLPNGKKIRQKIRLANCDAPEKTKRRLYNHKLRRHETNSERNIRIQLALEAKHYANIILKNGFYIQYVEKYRDSRIVCNVFSKENINLKLFLKEQNLLTGKYE